MPSATEVEQNGVDLGEINTRLLQKVEELTLQIINENGNRGIGKSGEKIAFKVAKANNFHFPLSCVDNFLEVSFTKLSIINAVVVI
jgi:hypothetical protein